MSTTEFKVTMSRKSTGALGNQGAAFCRPIRDSLHLLQILGVVFAQQEGVGEGAQVLPRGGRLLLVVGNRDLLGVGGDLLGEQVTVLIAALVWFSLDVNEGPPFVGVPEGGAEPADGLDRDVLGDILDLLDRDVIEPRLARRLPVQTQVQPDAVLSGGGKEENLRLSPTPALPRVPVRGS